jgi:hypothetical protein
MKVAYELDGTFSVTRSDLDGQELDTFNSSDLSPQPTSTDFATLAEAYSQQGAVIYSSQWVGWVPEKETCGDNGNISNSNYTVSNLKVVGSVLKGPEPAFC